jgi:hydrogenase-4 component F
MMFLLAGRVMHRYRTTEIREVSGLLKVMPVTGGLFAVGMLAIIGLPPFGIFVSEFALIRAGFAAGNPWVMAIVLTLLAVAFIALINHLNRMLYGAAPVGVTVGEGNGWALAPLTINVAVLAVLGLLLPAPLLALLNQIVGIVSR